jgi:MYXO-CTERM domain-containing protein
MSLLLGRVLVLALAAGVVLTSTTPADAFCRTTTQPIPANYNPANRGCFKDGLLLYWRGACVSYSINADGSTSVPFDTAKRIIDEAFATWTTTTCADTGQAPGIAVSNAGTATCGEVRYNPESANQNLIVFRDDGWPYSDPNNTLGLTTVTFNAETGEIYDADLEINASGRNLSTTDEVPANGFDLASVVTHEAGHFLGLAHATDSKATMFASYKPGTKALRSVTPDDVAGLCAIYPNATTRIVSPTAAQQEVIAATPCDPTPRHGLTEKCEVPTPQANSKQNCNVAVVGDPSSSSFPLLAVGLAVALAASLAVRRRAKH